MRRMFKAERSALSRQSEQRDVRPDEGGDESFTGSGKGPGPTPDKVESLENAVKRGRAGGTLPVKAESLKNAIKRQRFKGAS